MAKQETNVFKEKEWKIKGYIEIPGEIGIVLTAPHAQGPKADKFTGEIAYRIANNTKAYALISTVSRTVMDYNLPYHKIRNTPFRRRINELIKELRSKNQEILLIDIHGIEKPLSGIEGDIDVVFGTRGGATIDPNYIDLLRNTLDKYDIKSDYAFIIHPGYIGGDIVDSQGKPTKGIHSVQLELAPHLRNLGEKRIIDALTDFIQTWKLMQIRHEIKKAPIYRLIKESGAQRISPTAVETLRDIIEYLGIEIVNIAVKITKNNQRKTVLKSDINQAVTFALKKSM